MDFNKGATMVANMSVSFYGDLRKRYFRNWSQAIVAIEAQGETLFDFAIGKQHAIAACTSGQVYTYMNPDTLTQPEAQPREPEYLLAPLSFREALRDPIPRITKICCGERHALMLSDKGLLFAWGMNNRGQCGVGKYLPEKVYLEATCLQKWAQKPVIGIQSTEPQRQALPRIKTIACGANHSSCIDAEGSMYMWGEHQGVGLFNLRAAKGSLGNVPSFLLFKMSQEISSLKKTDKETTKGPGMSAYDLKAYNKEQQKQLIRKLANAPRNETKLSSAGQDFTLNAEDFSGKLEEDLFENATEDAEELVETVDHMASFKKALKGMHFKDGKHNEVGSLRAMLQATQDIVAAKEINGDVLTPTRCCSVVLSRATEAPRLRVAGTPVLECWPGYEEWCAPVFPAPERGAQFVDVAMGVGMNCALSDKGYLYTWGNPDKGLLGRPVAVQRAPAAPERIPFFPQLAISLSQVSVGRDHVIALATHGRVFTWGKVDACLGPSGFQRCTLEEPMFVEGLLRELRVVRVAAGRLESVIATEDFDAVLGWEMLEMSSVGHRMLPVAYQYTFTGPRSGLSEANLDRLSVTQSDAVHFVMVGGPASSKPHLHGLDPYPTEFTSNSCHQFARKNDGTKRRLEAAPPKNKTMSRGLAHTELFQWAARSTGCRRPTTTDPRLKRAAASMVSPSFGARKRDVLDVDRDLSGFRRLALSRATSQIMNVNSNCYKEEAYDAREEFLDSPLEVKSSQSADSTMRMAAGQSGMRASNTPSPGTFRTSQTTSSMRASTKEKPVKLLNSARS